MRDWSKLADKQTVEDAVSKLKERGIDATFVQTSQEAKNKVLQLIPEGSRVLTSQSETSNAIGIPEIIDNSGKYVSVRKEYMSFDHETQADKIRIARAIPDYIVASVHAVTKNGEVMIASNTGSQLAAYAYGAGKVIWIIGTQKFVENLEEGFKRIYDYVLGLESERLKKVYGVPSNVSKILIIDKETVKGRITAIFVNEVLGF